MLVLSSPSAEPRTTLLLQCERFQRYEVSFLWVRK